MVRKLLEQMLAEQDRRIPTTTLGRFRRSATAALRVGTAAVLDRTRRLLRAFYAPVLEPGSRSMNAELVMDLRPRRRLHPEHHGHAPL